MLFRSIPFLCVCLLAVVAITAWMPLESVAQSSDIRAKILKAAGETSIRSVSVGLTQRRYAYYVPKNYAANGPLPIVFAFHGGGGNPQSMMALSGLNAKAEQAGFIAVYPYGSGVTPDQNLSFNGGDCCGYAKDINADDIGMVRAILNDIAARYTIDHARVFATGISNGGIMAYRVACELSDRVAAIAPVGGPLEFRTCNPAQPVAVMHFHGTADEYAPYEGGVGRASANAPVRPVFNSAHASIRFWLAVNVCKPDASEALPDTTDDGMRSVRLRYTGCRSGLTVELVRIEGGGHTWPGQAPLVPSLGASTSDISANDMMWTFFQANPLNKRQNSASAK
jgi:poly(3-hydroxybutyrate) depolymerase